MSATRVVFTIFVCLSVTTPVDLSFVRINKENGGYENVIVAISNAIEESENSQLLPVLKNFLEKASIRLNEATYGRAYFNSVAILLPDNWRKSSEINYLNSTFETHFEADVRLEPSTTEVTVQQRGSCGEPGAFINISPEFLRQWNEKNDDDEAVRKFVRAWAKYRYGIFDETPITSSSAFHSFHYGFRGITVTGCSDPYPWILNNCSWIENHINGDCEATLNTTVAVSTSIMDDVTLQAERFCNASNHDVEAPTRHNTLCMEKSTWEVIASHEDFQNLNNPTSEVSTLKPNVYFVSAKPMRAVLVVDSIFCNTKNEAFKTIRDVIVKALKEDFPRESRLGVLFAHMDKMTTESLSSNINPSQAYLGYCNIKPSEVNTRDILKALSIAHKVLEHDTVGEGRLGGDIILFVYGEDLPSNLLFPSLNDARNGQIRYHIIAYPPMITSSRIPISADNLDTFPPEVTWFNIPKALSSGCDLKARIRMDAAFRNIIGKRSMTFRNNLMKIHEAYYQNKSGNGSFYVPSKGNIILEIVFCIYEEMIPPITFEVNNEDYINKLDGLDKTYLKYGIRLRIDDSRQQTYNIKYNNDDQTFAVFVWFEGDSPVITLDGRISQHEFRTTKTDTTVQAVILRAELFQNNDPITNAFVSAVVTDPNGNDIQVELFDTGNGDPDINKNDGVYSRYFTNVSSIGGWYSVRIDARSNGTSSLASTPGSFLPSFAISTVIGDFFSPNTTDSEFSFPPSRITDFRVARMSNEFPNVTFEWTAPGSYFDHGRVDIYKLKCDQNQQALDNYEIYDNITLSPSQVGILETYTRPIPDNEISYCAILAQNNQGISSHRSNIVTITNDTNTFSTTINSFSTIIIPPIVTEPATNSSGNEMETNYEITNATTVILPQETTSPTAILEEGGDGKLTQNEIIIVGCMSGIILIVMMIVVGVCIKHKCSSNEPPVKTPRRLNSSRYNIDVVRSNHRPESFARADEDDAEFNESVRENVARSSSPTNEHQGRSFRFHGGRTSTYDDSGCSTTSNSPENYPSQPPGKNHHRMREIGPPQPRSPPPRYDYAIPAPVSSPPPIPPRHAPVSPPFRQPPYPPKLIRPISDYSGGLSSTTTLYSMSEESIPYSQSSSDCSSPPPTLELEMDHPRRPSGVPVLGTLV